MYSFAKIICMNMFLLYELLSREHSKMIINTILAILTTACPGAHLQSQNVVRRAADDDGRPLQRIKLDESEIAKESDVVTLQKPYLDYKKIKDHV